MKKVKGVLTILILVIIFVCFVTLGGEGGLGSIIVFTPVICLLNRSKSQRKTVSQMNGYEYECWCAEQLMKTKGFRSAIVTPASGDYGADIIAVDSRGQKWVFQCKHYKRNVPNTAVQEAVAAKAHYKADRAGVITNSQLTKQARELAWENAVELIEGLSD